MEGPSSSAPPIADSEDDDTALANSEFLTRQELLKRRSGRLSQLAKCYRDYYWTLMEDLKRKHREYYWKFGKSPFRDDDNEAENGAVPGFVNNNNNNNDTKNHSNNCSHQKENGDIATNSSGKLGLGFDDYNRCAFPGCRSKAMALSAYCHSHILSDTKQKLYKDCKFVLKSTGAGPILCSKPILVTSIPSLCPAHLLRAEKMFKGLLRKEGAPVASSNKLASKFHLVIAEYINLIQSRRRAAAGVNIDDIPTKDSAT